MTTEPKPSDDAENPEGDDDDSSQAATASSSVTTRDRRRWRSASERRKILKDQTYRALADAVRKPIIWTFHSEDVEGGSGKPRTVREFLDDVVQMAEATGETFRLLPVDFRSSVVFELQPVIVQSVLNEIDARVADDPEGEPTDQDLELLIPETVAAGAAIATIIALPPEEAFEAALEYRPAMAVAYGALAKTLVKERAELEISAPGEVVAELDSATAKEAEDLVDTTVPAAHQTVYVRGILTMADAKQARFRVTIDDEVRPPELHGRTSAIDGPYNEASKQAVEKHGLWNKRVVAEVLVLRERRRDSRHARVAGYAFQAIRPFATAIDPSEEPEWARRLRAPDEAGTPTPSDESATETDGEQDSP